MSRHTSYSAKVPFGVLCQSIDSPYSLKAHLLLREGDKAFLEYLKMPAPRNYLDRASFNDDYLVFCYLKKYTGFKAKIDRKEAALSKWRIAEEQCATTNSRFRSNLPMGNAAEAAILRAQKRISKVLGEFKLSKVLKGCSMGPGATFDLRRTAKPGTKRTIPLSVSNRCVKHAKAWLAHDSHWLLAETGWVADGPYSPLMSVFNVVKGNRLSTAPKDSLADRITCIEPTFDMFMQKGVGAFMRSRLKKFGIDLDDQSRNQDLAREAYEKGYATIDLSSASDTICSYLVRVLLPLEWSIFLDDLRATYTRMPDGSWHENSKYSSMGNGFTFELESLIFWALSPEGCDLVSVYGDDIVCSKSYAVEYIKILESVGFSINWDKSFIDGRFFESCGLHFFDGQDVTPVYQKEIISTPSSYVRASNRLARKLLRSSDSFDEKSPEYAAMTSIYENYPFSKRPAVPFGCDDRGFYLPLSSFKHIDPNRGVRCDVLYVPTVKTAVRQDGLYAQKLHNPSSLQSNLFGRKGYLRTQGDERDCKLKRTWIYFSSFEGKQKKGRWLPGRIPETGF